MLGLYFFRRVLFVISVFLGLLLLAFPQFILNASHLSCVVLGKIAIGCRGEAAVAMFVRVLLFVVSHDREALPRAVRSTTASTAKSAVHRANSPYV